MNVFIKMTKFAFLYSVNIYLLLKRIPFESVFTLGNGYDRWILYWATVLYIQVNATIRAIASPD